MSERETPDLPVGGVDAGALLADRHYIKVAAQSLPVALARQVLQTMDERRRLRRTAPEKSTGLPEMSLAETQREIAWRLATLPFEDARAIAEFVRQLASRSQ